MEKEKVQKAEKKEEEKEAVMESKNKRHQKNGKAGHNSKKTKVEGPIKRIQSELREILLDPPFGIIAAPKSNDLYEWEGKLNGPRETPYEGGVFFVDIHFPEDYPFQPPKITFKTRIYHCNINSNGSICLDTLKNNWSGALSISKVLIMIMELLAEPNPADPLVKQIAVEMMNDPEKYFKTAQEWTKKYASPSLIEPK